MQIGDNKISLFTCAAFGLFFALVVTAVPTHAQTESVLYSFCAKGKSCPEGEQPQFVTLVADAKGNLYGTTTFGGAHKEGTVFRLTAAGVESVYSFQNNGTDGIRPLFGVVFDKAGNLYGTTPQGGTNNDGVVYKITSSGVESVLYAFGTNPGDGGGPEGALVNDAAGNLYGTTGGGGAYGNGTVFEVTPSGVETILYSFQDNGSDGETPFAGLAMDTQGNLYGTTANGGVYFKGTVFEVTSSGVETILHNFQENGTDGYYPSYAPLVVDAAGNLYGTTDSGGTHGLGIAFELTPSGVETILHNWGSSTSDGQFPYGGMILDAAGNLYGTTDTGGPNGEGTVFKLTPSGTETILYSFPANPTDGETPLGGLLSLKGSFYGTTYSGGTYGYGTVFKLTP